MRRQLLALVAVIGAFIILCGLYIRAIPPMEGSDEYEHFAYVTWLIEQRSFPIQGEAGWHSPVRQESGQPPLYYLLAALPARAAGTQPPLAFRPNPYFQHELDPTLPDNKNTALHYPADRGGAWRAIYFARAVSVASGVLLILCTYGLAGGVFLGHKPALAAAMFVAFMPQVIYHSSHVSNDILAAALATLALWMTVRLVRNGGSLPRGLAAGAALGLAALVKVNTLVIGLPVALAVLRLWLGNGSRLSGRERFRAVLVTSSGIAIGFVLVAGWWFVRSFLIYGSLLGLDTHCYQALSTCGPIRLVAPNLIAWRDTFRSFWAAFGLANIRPYDWVYWLFAGLIGLAVAGLLRPSGHARPRPPDATAGGEASSASDPHYGFLLTLMALAVAGNVLLLYIWMQQILATYGRLLFPTLGAFIVLLIAGLWALRPRLATMAWLLPATLAVISPFWLIRPAYARQDFLDESAVEVSGESLGWRYGDFAELIRVSPATNSAAAGETLPVEVCWRALKPAAQNYTVFLQAVGPENGVVAARYTYPGLGSYPTEIWQAGRIFCDTIRLPIAEELAATLVYRLSAGLLDDASDERLPGVGAAGDPVPPFAGAVRLAAREPGERQDPPDGDAAIRLAGADFSGTWRPDSANSIILEWYAAETVPVDYHVFLHLRDASDRLVAQADGPPLAGWYPTSWWSAGERVTDNHVFALPADVPPGLYRLVAGLYDPVHGGRMGEELVLGAITVDAGSEP
jgi:4-amino-4-deoxy-L-arabinose transferase-like glycosyltransferase